MALPCEKSYGHQGEDGEAEKQIRGRQRDYERRRDVLPERGVIQQGEDRDQVEAGPENRARHGRCAGQPPIQVGEDELILHGVVVHDFVSNILKCI